MNLRTKSIVGHTFLCFCLTMPTVGVTAAGTYDLRGDVVALEIKSQRIAEALYEWSRQSGIQVVYYLDITDEPMKAPALRGIFTPDQALQTLLSKTGLKFSYINAQTVAIHREAREAAELKLSALEGAELPVVRLVTQHWTSEQASNELVQTGGSPTAGRGRGSREDRRRHAIEEVIVTARKREERLQDVPMSIAVVTADDIDRKGLVNAEDYLRGLPAVNQVGGMGAIGGQAIVIRGLELGNLWQNTGAGPTTATYFGETPTTNSAGLSGGSNIDIKLVDIERVEVLKGPQGTAFGNSSMGGAVRTIPVAPRLADLEGKVAAGYSATSGNGGDSYNIQAVGNVPLIRDKLAIRATAYQYQDGGFYRNRAGSDPAFQTLAAATGAQAFARNEEEVGSYYAVGARVAGAFQATHNLRFTLSYLTQKTETDGFALATSGPYEQTILQVAPEHVRRGEESGLIDYDIDIANAVMEYDFDWADLLATYSYVKGDSVYVAPYQTFGLPWAASADRPMEHREHAGEIRLVTKLDGAWNFLGGLYAEKLDDEYVSELVWFGDPAAANVVCARCPGDRVLFNFRDARDLRQNAAFGEVSWEFLPRFTLTGGARVYEYERTIRVDRSGPAVGGSSSQLTQTDASGSNLRANLNYQPQDNVLVYASWAEGFRFGKPAPLVPVGVCDTDGNGVIDGTNLAVKSAETIRSDSVDSYELGGKVAIFDHRLTIDAAVFRMDWSNFPLGARLPCGFGYLANAGGARSEGVEFQANIHFTDAFVVGLGGSYVDAHITKSTPTAGFSAGAELPSPKVNAHLGLQYAFDIAGHASFVRADAIHVGSFHDVISRPPNSESGDYVKLDLSARVAVAKLNIDLFVRNLTNEDAFTFRGGGGGGAFNPFYGYRLRPRTFGLQLGYNF